MTATRTEVARLVSPVTVTLRGNPAPAGSLKCVGGKKGHQLVQDYRPGQKDWKALIVAAFRDGVAQAAGPYQPVGVDVTFTVCRPTSHYRTGRNRHLLRDDAPGFPTGHNTNDLDKMLRLLGDALQASGFLVDDAQVIAWAARKRYPDSPHPDLPAHPGARIHVYPITEGQQ